MDLHTIDTLIKLRRGRVTVKVRTVYDENPDTSYLGEGISGRNLKDLEAYKSAIYSCNLDAVRLPGSDLWRDRKGRIVATEPPDDTYAREYKFYKLNTWDDDHKLEILFSDADRLRALYNNDWSYIGIIATVHIDGREIGEGACWGYESDMLDSDLRSMARMHAREAISEARTFIKSLQPATT